MLKKQYHTFIPIVIDEALTINVVVAIYFFRKTTVLQSKYVSFKKHICCEYFFFSI